MKFGSLALALTILLSLNGIAQERKKLTEVTIVGEVVDSKCYMTQGMGPGRGEEHKECAEECAKGGIPLSILEDKTDVLFFAVKAKGMSGANEMLLPYVGEKVVVKGKLAERSGARLLLIETVERAK